MRRALVCSSKPLLISRPYEPGASALPSNPRPGGCLTVTNQGFMYGFAYSLILGFCSHTACFAGTFQSDDGSISGQIKSSAFAFRVARVRMSTLCSGGSDIYPKFVMLIRRTRAALTKGLEALTLQSISCQERAPICSSGSRLPCWQVQGPSYEDVYAPLGQPPAFFRLDGTSVWTKFFTELTGKSEWPLAALMVRAEVGPITP